MTDKITNYDRITRAFSPYALPRAVNYGSNFPVQILDKDDLTDNDDSETVANSDAVSFISLGTEEGDNHWKAFSTAAGAEEGDLHWKSKATAKNLPTSQLSPGSIKAATDLFPDMSTVTTCDMFPASFMQASMITASIRDRRHYANQYELSEVTSPDRLRSAFLQTISRHEMLRTTFFTTAEDGVVQLVLPPENVDAESAFKTIKEGTVQEYLESDKEVGFGVGDRLWLRLAVVQVTSKSYLPILTIHHALFDAMSLPMIAQDLYHHYQGINLPRTRSVSFRPIVDHFNATPSLETEHFWSKHLYGIQPATPLSLETATRGGGDDHPAHAIVQVCETPMKSMREAAKAMDVPIAVLMKAAWALTLFKYTRADSICFGEVTSGRHFPVENINLAMGPTINTVPFRLNITQNESILTTIKKIKTHYKEMLQHSHVSLSQIKRWHQMGHQDQLFDTMLVFQRGRYDQVAKNSDATFKITKTNISSKALACTFEMELFPGANQLEIQVMYDHDAMAASQAYSLIKEFNFSISQLIRIAPEAGFWSLPSLWIPSPTMRSHIEASAVGAEVAIPHDLVHKGVESRAARHPEWTAVECGGTSITYGELENHAGRLAMRLWSEFGVRRGSRVAVVMQRTIEFPVALFAVLKTGGVIVPLDSKFPLDRMQFIMEDANVSAIITTMDDESRVQPLSSPSRPLIIMNTKEALHSTTPTTITCEAEGSDAFLIVYTSGSTGKPKGVPVSHRGASNVIFTLHKEIGCWEHARVLQFMAIGFDACQCEIWTSLNHGSVVVLRTDDWQNEIKTCHSVNITPTGLAQMGNPDPTSLLEQVTVGGEGCPKALMDLWSSHVRFVNAYGPTETTFISHFTYLSSQDRITIGRPIPNMRSYILDSQQRPVPSGVIGEIYIGGTGVSTEYLNLPTLTMTRFLKDPFTSNPEGRMFRTGDLGRLLANGHYEILGRMDDQVKLKGYRIELDEIASAMMKHEEVTSAAVVVKDKKHLIGFFTPKTVDLVILRDLLVKMLPVYMVPHVLVGLDSMPTSPNGKTDRKALSALPVELTIEDLNTAKEREIAQIWTEVLEVSPQSIGRNSSFFALGGDSLSVIKVVAALKARGWRVTVADIFKEHELSRIAALEQRLVDSGEGCVGGEEKRWPAVVLSPEAQQEIRTSWPLAIGHPQVMYDAYPTTPLQSGMALATILNRSAYLHHITWRSTTTVNLQSLQTAFNEISATHPILRTAFIATSSQGICQAVWPDASAFAFVQSRRCEKIDAFLAEDREVGFEMNGLPWLRVSVVEEKTGQEFVVLSIHHALYDGWSLPKIMDALIISYTGGSVPTAPNFRHMVDYIFAQDVSSSESFWRTYLKDVEPSLLTAPGYLSEDSALETEIVRDLEEVQIAARKAGVTLAVFMKAAWGLTLRKYTRDNDVVFGQVLAGRDVPVKDIESIVGPTLNTIPCRITFDDNMTVSSTIKSIQSYHGSILPYSHCSLSDIQKWTGAPSNKKLFNTLFVYENIPSSKTASDPKVPFILTKVNSERMSAAYTFELVIFPQDTSLLIRAQFISGELSVADAKSILTEFDVTVSQLIAALKVEDSTVGSLWELSIQQQSAIEAFCTGPIIDLPFELLHHGFEIQAAAHPEWTAVEFLDQTITYGALNYRATAIASKLLGLGVCGGQCVGVMIPRSMEFPLALVAATKAEAGYVPLDPNFPTDRLKFMMEDSRISGLITRRSETDKVLDLNMPDLPVVYVDDFSAEDGYGLELNLEGRRRANRADTAFIIYTSGSTGKPKGVPIPQAGAVNIMTNCAEVFGASERTRVAQAMAIGFDACQAELWSTFTKGGCLVLRNDTMGLDFFKTVTSLFVTPTGLSHLEDPKDYPNLKHIVVSGEACSVALKNKWVDHVTFYNCYGPSEISVITHASPMKPNGRCPVGLVVPNAAAYVLDKNMRHVPFGTYGDVYSAGIGVTDGYLGLPQLNAERFMPDPFSNKPGARMFRSGDLGRLLPSGEFELAGRLDDQVKFKGYRIELDEVGEAIMNHPKVASAAAVLKDNKHLIGFYSPPGLSSQELTEFVSTFLPSFMVPTMFVGLEVMPINVNGKTDKKALRAMEIELEVEKTSTETERLMAEIWNDVLKVPLDRIGSSSSFFALGGDSISAIRVVAKAKSVGLIVSTASIFKYMNLDRISLSVVKSQTTDTTSAVSSLPVVGDVPLTPIQHLFFGHEWKDRNHFNQGFVLIPREKLDVESLTKAVAKIVLHHDMLRARFTATAEGGWRQTLLAPEQCGPANVKHIRISSIDELELAVKDVQSSLRISDGSIYAVALIDVVGEASQRLLVTAHHLVIDLVSLRVVLDDLEHLLNGKDLPPKTLSYQQWAAEQVSLADRLDASVWLPHLTGPVRYAGAPDAEAVKFNARGVCNAAVSSLLDMANITYNTNIQELTIAALLLSYGDVLGQELQGDAASFGLMMESHGRDGWDDSLDVTSTVGWFTSVHPVVFRRPSSDSLGSVIKSVKQSIRGLPAKGVSFGMLKYLATESDATSALKKFKSHPMSFNYLGKFQSVGGTDSFFSIDNSLANNWSTRNDDSNFHEGSLTCMHVGDELILRASLNTQIISTEAADQWMKQWSLRLEELIHHCMAETTLGGYSLSDMTLVSSLNLLEEIELNIHSTLNLKPSDYEDIYPVTPLQFAFLSAMMKSPGEYTVAHVFDIVGEVDFQRLQAAWSKVVDKYKILRTVFCMSSQGLYQVVTRKDRTQWSMEPTIWNSTDEDDLRSRTLQFVQGERRKGFSMDCMAYQRFHLVSLSVTDGWSSAIMFSSLQEAYDGTLSMREPMPFKSHVQWLLEQPTDQSEKFWKTALESSDARKLDLPRADAEQLAGPQYDSIVCYMDLSGISDFCKSQSVTVATLLNISWALTLRHYTRSADVRFGSVVSGRDNGNIGNEEIVGVLINTIAIPCRLPAEMLFTQAMKQIHTFFAETIPHSHHSLVDVQRWSGLPQSEGLFDSLLIYENFPKKESKDSSFSMTRIDGEESVDLPISVVVSRGISNFKIRCTFDAHKLSKPIIHRLVDRFSFVLQQACSATNAMTVSDFDILSDSEAADIQRFSYGGEKPLPYELVHHGFEERACVFPDWPAVELGSKVTTYGELDARANAVAEELQASGVRVGSCVAIIMQRCLEFPLALLSTLKSGATVVPIDSKFPSDRIDFILRDAGITTILTTASESTRIAALDTTEVRVLELDWKSCKPLIPSKRIRSGATSRDVFMIVYTSGSTGNPKGVPIPHKGAVNIIALQSPAIGCVPGARVMQFMAIGFDVCAWEVWGSLNHGCTLVLREEDAFSTMKKVDVIHITPTGLASIEDPETVSNWKHIVVGGEGCPPATQDKWASRVIMTNVYGPTETSIISHAGVLKAGGIVNIGRPAANNRCYVLDDQLNRVPIGVIGEFYTSTPGVQASQGYLNLPEMTKERFLDDLFVPGGRMFKTGDVGRMLADGTFEILGRKDNQVKVKGYRIELDEVAFAITKHSDVVTAAAILNTDGYLVAFYTPECIDPVEIRDVVSDTLPLYMVPEAFIGLETMPINSNGKIDKKALAQFPVVITIDALETDTERTIASIWAEVLNLDVAKIGRHASFFALGGDSLTVIKVAAASQKAGFSINVADIFSLQNVDRVAKFCDSSSLQSLEVPNIDWSVCLLEDLGEIYRQFPSAEAGSLIAYPATPLQAGMFAATLQNSSAYTNQLIIKSITKIDVVKLELAFRTLLKQHTILRSSLIGTMSSGVCVVVHEDISDLKIACFSGSPSTFLPKDKARGFSSSDKYWIRLTHIVESATLEHVVLTIHHTLYDGWSLPIIADGLVNAYFQKPLVESSDFQTVVNYINAQDRAATKTFWTTYLKDIPMAQQLELGAAVKAENEELAISRECKISMAEVQKAAQRGSVTPANFLKAAWALTLRKYCRSNDIVFGQVLAGREIPVRDASKIVGPLLNTVPIRVRLTDELSIIETLKSVQADHSSILSHSYVGLHSIQKWCLEEESSKLFHTLFVYENLPNDGKTGENSNGFAFESGHIPDSRSLAYSYEVLLFPGDVLSFKIRFDHSVMTRSQALSILDEYEFTIQQALRGVRTKDRIGSMWSLSPAQTSLIEHLSHGPSRQLPYTLIHHAFEVRAKRHPELPAIEFGSDVLSYGDLNNASRALAITLLEMGVTVGTRVAVLMQRCLEYPIALLAVLKVGGIIVPHDSSFPSERLNLILKDSSAQFIISTPSEAERITALNFPTSGSLFIRSSQLLQSVNLSLPSAPDIQVSGSDNFAIIYTSGSTGVPKGVPLSHVGAVNVITTFCEVLGMTEGTRVLQFMAIGFDVCQRELWGALSNGCVVVLRSEDIFTSLKTVHITHITPTGLSQLSSPQDYPLLKAIALCGEPCPWELKEKWATSVKLVNAYGPTEVSFISHMGILSHGAPIRVGKVLPNNRCFVLDRNGFPVPLGCEGELYTGSPGVDVSTGYINLPDMTTSRFVEDPFSPGRRLFRTGDSGRLLPTGEYELLGRLDDQVKLKGYRIEMNEIVSSLLKYPGIKNAAVIVKDRTRLVGFVAPDEFTSAEIRAFLSELLPIYMVPADIVLLKSMPTTPNGKTDKKLLSSLQIDFEVEAPATDTEQKMAAIWADCLKIRMDSIGRNSSFFALGGDSLSIIRTVAACQQKGLRISVPELFRLQFLDAAAKFCDCAGNDLRDEVSIVDWPEVTLTDVTVTEIMEKCSWVGSHSIVAYPTTPLQAGMLAATVRDSDVYLNQLVLKCADKVEWLRLNAAFQTLLEHHDILRSTFVSTTNDGICQVVLPNAIDASVEVVSGDLKSFMLADKARGFKFGQRLWIRATLVTDTTFAEESVILTLHHALYDGWSLPIIAHDFINAYCGEPLSDGPEFRKAVNYIYAQDQSITKAFWTEYLLDARPTGRIQLAAVRGPEEKCPSLSISCESKPTDIRECAKRFGVTTANLLKVAWALTLRKFMRSNDVLFGQVIACRDIPVTGAERIVGPLLNTVPCRVRFDDESSIVSLMQQLQAEYSSMLPHAHAGLKDIHQWHGQGKDLFQSLFVYENVPRATKEAKALPMKVSHGSTMSSKAASYGFELVINPYPTEMRIHARFDLSDMDDNGALSILHEFSATVSQLCDNSSDRVGSLWALSTAQMEDLSRFGVSAKIEHPFALVHQGFEERALKHSDRIAVDFQGETLTYGQLDNAGNVLASELSLRDIRPGSRVAVIMQRCLELPIALLSILKAGATVVPLDSKLPRDRIQFILKDAAVQLILGSGDASIKDMSDSVMVPYIWISADVLKRPWKVSSAARRPLAKSCDAFMVVYTSGSTGTPKGVPVSHSGAINAILHSAPIMGYKEGYRVAQFMAIGFDACSWEIWAALNSGSTLVLREEAAFNTLRNVDSLVITPTGLAQLADPEKFPLLKYVTLCGEPCPRPLQDKWACRVKLSNAYGPTEISIISHIGRMTAGSVVTVGDLVPNSRCYILDESMRMVPSGSIGEVYLGTPGVNDSDGYINLAKLTAERFISDPFSIIKSDRLFKSGDLGRFLPNGKLEILGRVDDQVKLKGYRIELAEVSSAMMKHPGIQNAAVIVKDGKSLVGFFTPPSVVISELRSTMVNYLQSYMIPSLFIGLEELPISTNGKTDKKALALIPIQNSFNELETETERSIAAIFSEVLKVPITEIGSNTSFFEIGGDSLSIIAVADIFRTRGFQVNVSDIFRLQTINQISIECEKVKTEVQTVKVGDWPVVHLSDDGVREISDIFPTIEPSNLVAFPMTPLQSGMFAATLRDPSAYVNQVVIGFKSKVDVSRLNLAFCRLLLHHSILRTSMVGTVSSGMCQVIQPSIEDLRVDSFNGPVAIFLSEDKARGFSSNDKYWIRVTHVVESLTEEHVVCTIHHNLYDGWSLSTIVDDLIAAYFGKALAERPQFQDFVNYIYSQDRVASKTFWLRYLNGVEPVQSLELEVASISSDEDLAIGKECSISMIDVQQAAQRAGVTAATLLKAAWGFTLRKYLRSNDVLFGQVLANREVPIHDAKRALLSHAHIGLNDIQQWITGSGHEKLFQTIFVYENIPKSQGVSQEGSFIRSGAPKTSHASVYTYELILHPKTDTLLMEIYFDHSKMSRKHALAIADEFDFTVAMIRDSLLFSHSSRTVKDFWSLSPSQLEVLRAASQGPNVILPYTLVHLGVEARAKKHPNWVAIECAERTITYGELETKARRLAVRLYRKYGVTRGSRVGVVMQRTFEFPIALFAVLKTGAITVPLDSKFPLDRMQYMMEDANVSLIITTAKEEARVQPLADGSRPLVILDLDDLDFSLSSNVEDFVVPCEAQASDPFLIVYTSGSTGKPKGVPVLHKGASNVIWNLQNELGFWEHSRSLQFMAIGFDACQCEIWMALNHGSVVVLRTDNWQNEIKTCHNVSITPTGLSQLGKPDPDSALKNLAVGGEGCPKALMELWSEKVKFLNAYGPTETTFVSHVTFLKPGDRITVGKPIANMRCYILDHLQREVPVGVVGEIYNGGIGVAGGYMNMPELTDERFVADPFTADEGGLMFKTGDLGRLLDNGHFEILGRIDDQVKLKGYRIELDEIASAIMKHPGIDMAAAIVKDKKHLVGFFTPSSVDLVELKELLAKALPVYMIPPVLVGLESMPMNANGKTDKKVLSAIKVEIILEELINDQEREIASVWASALEVSVETIGRNSSFFALGGDSLSVIKVVAELKARGWKLSVADIFNAQELSRIVALEQTLASSSGSSSLPSAELSLKAKDELRSIWVPAKKYPDMIFEAFPVTPLQSGLVLATMMNRSSYLNHIVWKAIKTVDTLKLNDAFARVSTAHAILRTSFVATSSDGICQAVWPNADFAQVFNYHSEIKEFLIKDKDAGFEINGAPWVRLSIVNDGELQYVVLTIHHALYDGWSLPKIADSIVSAYSGGQITASPSFRNVVDYIYAQDTATSEAFWRSYMKGVEPSVVLSPGFKDDDLSAGDDAEIVLQTKDMQKTAMKAGITLAVLMKSAWALTLR
ncbi:hypothetical protein HDU67_003455, partial [Dinochytrium kinnereticum]